MPILHFHHQARRVWSWRWTGGSARLGRADDCDVALPSDTISRLHCVLAPVDGGWELRDQSRHGTYIDDQRVTRVRLEGGTTFQVGEYSVLFEDEAAGREVSATAQVALSDFEEVVAVDRSRRAALEVIGGPRAGTRRELDARRLRVGGPGADVDVDPQLPADACLVRVVRGRVMVERGSRPVYLEGQAVAELTPVWEGDSLRVGAATLELRTVEGHPTPRPRLTAFGQMVGKTPGMGRVFDVLTRVAQSSAPVLLLGESGTGKELAARGIHDAGPRAEGPFVAINCAAIPQNLAEAQLFGHERGAFTGADSRRDGAFQQADGGTLFLDELGEMTLDGQARLLRALESGEVTRVGGNTREFPDVRVVAATNRPLARLVEEGRFRQDLYFRLAVLTVELPPLREHLDDLPDLVRALLARHHPGARVTDAALRRMAAHPWPGNVRELRNVLTRAVVLGGPVVDAPAIAFAPGQPVPPPVEADTGDDERRAIADALRRHGNNRTLAAKALGIPRTSLAYKMMRYGLS